MRRPHVKKCKQTLGAESGLWLTVGKETRSSKAYTHKELNSANKNEEKKQISPDQNSTQPDTLILTF